MILTELKQLEQESKKRGIPIIGHEKGAWLLKKIKEHQPKLILELGTANGYSGIILGSEGAKLITVEQDPKRVNEAEHNFSKFNIKATVVNNDAEIEVKNTAKEKKNHNTFDLIFIDFAKKGYNKVLDDCIKLVKKRGIIIADNITMAGCRDFKERVLKHPQLKTEIIDIKDGLSCSMKVR
mgnify:CR=1 FL=1